MDNYGIPYRSNYLCQMSPDWSTMSIAESANRKRGDASPAQAALRDALLLSWRLPVLVISPKTYEGYSRQRHHRITSAYLSASVGARGRHLVQRDARGNRRVQRLNGGADRNRHDLVAGVAHQA